MSIQDFTEREQGRDQGSPVPQDPNGLPRNSVFNVPHAATAASRLHVAARAYSQRFDEVTTYNRANAERMLLDPVISGCMEILSDPVALLSWSIKPEDPENPLEVDAAARAEKYIKRIPRLTDHLHWLVYDGSWVGRSACQMRWNWSVDPKPYYAPTKLVNVTGDKLAFKWSGDVGIAVQSGSVLRNHPQTQFLEYPIYFLNDLERDGLLVHRRFSEDAAFYNNTQAGAIEGRGLRHYLYWIWVLKNEIWKKSLDWLQWFANGLMVYYFEHGNDEHMKAVKYWVENQTGDAVQMFPVFRDKANNPFTKPVERFDVSSSNPQFLQALITQYFDDLIRFRILHQSGTTQAINGGLGSGVAQAHETTFDSVIKINALLLGESLSSDMVNVMYRNNEPGIPPGKWVFNVDTPNAQNMVETATAIVGMGGSVPLEPILEAGGIPLPTKGQTVLGGPQPTQPTAVGAIPDGTPMIGADPSGSQPVQ